MCIWICAKCVWIWHANSLLPSDFVLSCDCTQLEGCVCLFIYRKQWLAWRRARGAKVNCCGWSPAHREWLNVWLVDRPTCSNAAVLVQFSPFFFCRFSWFSTLPTMSVMLFCNINNVNNIACTYTNFHDNSCVGMSVNLLAEVGDGSHNFKSCFLAFQFWENASSLSRYSSKCIWHIDTIQSFPESKFRWVKKAIFVFWFKVSFILKSNEEFEMVSENDAFSEKCKYLKK